MDWKIEVTTSQLFFPVLNKIDFETKVENYNLKSASEAGGLDSHALPPIASQIPPLRETNSLTCL